MAKSALFKSSLAKKYWMSLTGLFLCLFLVGHLLGNLQLFQSGYEGVLQFNKYAHFMTTNPLVKILSYVTYISILFHAVDGLLLAYQNKKARPVNYAYNKPGANSSTASRNMAVLGTLVLIFISTHMINFWAKMKFSAGMPVMVNEVETMGTKQFFLVGTSESPRPSISVPDKDATLVKLVQDQQASAKKAKVESELKLVSVNKVINVKTGEVVFEGYKDLHKLTVAFFKSNDKLFDVIPKEGLFFTIFYVLSMIALSFHLWHGFQSAFQSLGANGSFTPAVKLFGKAFAIIVPFAFAAIPIFIRFILK
jgi:succinate dehydrogenase / fumarate reductase, cytochrome b subunit